jgi:SAM-dependent methyltransferase
MRLAVAEPTISAAVLCPGCGVPEVHLDWLQAPDRFHGRQKVYSLARCQSCSLVWLQDPPTPAEMGEHYGADYDRAITAAGEDPRQWSEALATVRQYKSGGSVLDLGCSSGGFLKLLQGPAWSLYGIDMSEEVAKRAEAATGASVFVGDILEAPFADESFDAITCFHLFEHVYNPRELLTRVARWLKPGGVFFTMLPNIESAGRRIFGSYWFALELPRHLHHFSPESLSKLAEGVGLEQLFLTTHREVFIEHSARYVMDELFCKLGISRAPLAKLGRPSLPYRVARKAFRLTVLPVLSAGASLAGDGEIIHAVFSKR